MADPFDPPSRTTSTSSARSESSSHTLSAASTSSASRKGRFADMETSSGDVDRASISMPPSTKAGGGEKEKDKLAGARHQGVSHQSALTTAIAESKSSYGRPSAGSNSNPEKDEAFEPISKGNGTSTASLPEPANLAPRKSEPDLEANRMSFSSLFNTARSGPSSLGGGSSEENTGRHDGSDRATTATSALSVTTSSQNGSLSPALTGAMHPLANASLASSAPASSATTATTSRSQAGRTVRGRTTVPTRTVSTSTPTSTSPPASRTTTSSTTPTQTSTSTSTPTPPHPPRIGTIGICALDSKARSKPSRNILNRLLKSSPPDAFDIIIFGDKVILDEPVAHWPLCDFLISFFSDGFPLEKAIAYAKLRNPFCVNDLPMQTILWDRRICLYILDRLGVPTPERIEVNRDGGPVILTTDIAARVLELTSVRLNGSADGRGGAEPPPQDVHTEDDDDVLVVDGLRLAKPFVEKPVSGEDHNINIYYPQSQGGGGRRLFRKVNNKSSERDEGLKVPRCVSGSAGQGESWIYERFLKVENAEDVKAYTVGAEYCHAETRKSPVVDGLVKRNPNGKEIRYVTSLSKEEMVMASKIATGFGQRICGFDLLRVEERSYVIDVNGWSFVKDNEAYYDECAGILRGMFMGERERVRGVAAAAAAAVERERVGEGEGGGEGGVEKSASASASAASSEKTGAREKEKGEKGGVQQQQKPAEKSKGSALKSVFQSRSISQLRDSVSQAANRTGYPQSLRSPSGTTSPVVGGGGGGGLMSPPILERALSSARVGRDEGEGSSKAGSWTGSDGGMDVAAAAAAAGEEAPLASTTTTTTPTPLPAPAPKSQWKLKGMVAVIRHADRTPKQKFKFTFHTKPFVELLKGHKEEVLLVGEAALELVAVAVERAVLEGVEDGGKLRVLGNVLRRKRGLRGTKVQIKPLFRRPKENGEKSEKHVEEQQQQHPPDFPDANDAQTRPNPARSQTRQNSLSEVTMSRAAAADNNLVLDKLQLVIKWGGEPTHSARYQAADLGENMRNDLLLMNKDALRDVSIFTSSERRVTTSAQIFAAAFLDQKESVDVDVEREQILVRKDLLDDSNAAKDEMDRVKKKLKGLLRKGEKAPEQFAWPREGVPEPFVVVRRVVELMRFHRRVMRGNFARLAGAGGSEAVSLLERLKKPATAGGGGGGAGSATSATEGVAVDGGQAQAQADGSSAAASAVQARWCTGEDAELFRERWEKLFNEFVDAEKVDPSKVSELYDTMKFDALHNRQFLEWVFTPGKGVLAEEEGRERGERAAEEERVGRGEREGGGEVRTESQVARREFGMTHEGSGQPVREEEREGVVAGVVVSPAPLEEVEVPKRSETTASMASATEKKGNRPTFTERMGFRRKSTDLMSAAKTALAAQQAQQRPHLADAAARESYFNLYRGDANAPASQSKAKVDTRLEKLTELYNLCKTLFDFIGPQEYGITNEEKLEIGLLTSLPLLREIVQDLEAVQAGDAAKSFVYFTKESHIYTLLNCILEGGVQTKIARNAIPELDYLSQICFELYESENAAGVTGDAGVVAGADAAATDPASQFSYSIRITISPGCHTFDPLDVQLDSKHCIGCAPRRSLTAHGDWKQVIETLRKTFVQVKLPTRFTAVNLSEKMAGEGGRGREGEREGREGKGEREEMGRVGEDERKVAG
ncbi:hypothetical protein LTR08_009321 [Meristemomyces frigidus]|nr:hypothetical protein LTR08_009321 [Meristemomyces frigidus]